MVSVLRRPFGDSSFIVHYLGWLGWRLRPLEQTGSNFGSEMMTSNPLLTSVGRGTMVADVDRYHIRPVVDATYPLVKGPDAFARLEGGEQFGKIVLDIAS